ncbi:MULTISPECIES: sugar phosphate isomerase/epimerase family protein [unclassified Mesorhizobium]|uniref:sugar phosphate isomerase/epimerase family protein n=1 Tax=unclassified Mesorhizobium TaxID=325217 RepID=UPI000F75E4AC|nr:MULTISPECIES: sugar phosphate isomerase/epimerase family protein [unclassified Mesorhizobium]AZO05574.1 sugar phosphate isomerase/epimerase [Mesorhizobium sp. M2A.F.Ca.ET.043.02.1.1]RUW40908.1 sugar phosphate isomerase/epimerase [Mesorhizobium sp. M2A.F.Ca.ET.015.02.1.1]RUW76155.1 sugar phosphate isomerase/epimerase [Mesorhizobium sp. M2A.F.Ca.ET.067.02.1.1]RVC96298.1 sugar phosphate isomerase/epimerase [Mesorhizobium sp. M2A.F.Ca.ET.017.03.2.1]RVD07618.1 sugar phosphate isomerase/epimerase
MRDFTANHSALALNTATLGHNLDGHGAGWPIERVLDACAERGIPGIVFWRREIGDRAVEIGERVRAAGLSVVGLCRAPYLTGPLALPGRAAIMDDFRAAIDMAAGLGAPVLTIVCGGVEPGTKGIGESLKLVADRVAEAAAYAAASNVRLALEPLHPVYGGDRSCLVTMRDAVDLCLAIDAPNVGVAVDVYHVWWDRALAGELLRAGPKRIFGYHLCDWLAQTRDVLLDRGMMGEGVADLKAIRAAVEAAGYDGPCEVEVFSAQNWWKREPGDVLDTCVERFRSVC